MIVRGCALLLLAACAPAPPFDDGRCEDPFVPDETIEPYRPQFHFTPPTGWMNDPNGLVFFRGEWHVFYQHNPGDNLWGDIHWGHAVSKDLVTYEHLPVALAPHPQLGMVFSGSAVVDGDEMALIFTHAFGDDMQQKQSIATSADGRTFVEYAGNPVLPNPGIVDFRDPKVVRVDDAWVMVLAAGDRAHVYRSPDLKAWTKASEIGPFAGLTDTWECPDLFFIDGRWVFKVDLNAGLGEPGSRALAWVGAFDGATFAPDGDAQLLDHGPDFYAAQSFANAPDGRVVWTAWRDNWQYALGAPTEPWRGSLTVPRDVRIVDGAIVQRPVPELTKLRGACAFDERAIAVDGARELALTGDALDVEVELAPADGELGLEVRVADPETTKIGYDAAKGVVFVDRNESGDATFHGGFAGRFEAPIALRDGRMIALRVLIDRSSIEVFADDGRAVLTVNVYPRPIATAVRAFGKGTITSLRAWRMGDAIR